MGGVSIFFMYMLIYCSFRWVHKTFLWKSYPAKLIWGEELEGLDCIALNWGGGAISLKSLKFPPPLSMFKTISLKDHVGHIIYQSTLHLLAVAFLWEYIVRILSFLEYPNLIRPFKKMIWYDTGHLTVSQFTSQNILKSLIPPPSAMICDFRCAQV